MFLMTKQHERLLICDIWNLQIIDIADVVSECGQQFRLGPFHFFTGVYRRILKTRIQLGATPRPETNRVGLQN